MCNGGVVFQIGDLPLCACMDNLPSLSSAFWSTGIKQFLPCQHDVGCVSLQVTEMNDFLRIKCY